VPSTRRYLLCHARKAIADKIPFIALESIGTGKIAFHKIPAYFVFVDEYPTTAIEFKKKFSGPSSAFMMT
jgi:hypothetical protein